MRGWYIDREREIEKDTMSERDSKRDIVGVRENDWEIVWGRDSRSES